MVFYSRLPSVRRKKDSIGRNGAVEKAGSSWFHPIRIACHFQLMFHPFDSCLGGCEGVGASGFLVAAAKFCAQHGLQLSDCEVLLQHARETHGNDLQLQEPLGVLRAVTEHADGILFCTQRVASCDDTAYIDCDKFAAVLLHLLSKHDEVAGVAREGSWAFVTSANSRYYEKMRNLIGSILFWEPDATIAIFDLGLSSEQRERVSRWANVRVHDFNFDLYPPHVRTLTNFAWKPLVMNESLSIYESIFYLDTSVELRSPIDEIKSKIDKHGYFFVHQARACNACYVFYPASV
jgi:hypothetical protein